MVQRDSLPLCRPFPFGGAAGGSQSTIFGGFSPETAQSIKRSPERPSQFRWSGKLGPVSQPASGESLKRMDAQTAFRRPPSLIPAPGRSFQAREGHSRPGKVIPAEGG